MRLILYKCAWISIYIQYNVQFICLCACLSVCNSSETTAQCVTYINGHRIIGCEIPA